ncbi:MAG: hypothetical protein KDC83_11305 [Flavobacteriales bacterium]|nr:hypothetical protein [Flavobacteriales bacterium]
MFKGPVKKAVILFSILLFPSVLYLLLSTGKHNFLVRPVYGPKEVTPHGDTLYYSIPNVQFEDCRDSRISLDDLDSNILVIVFFGTGNENLDSRINSQMLALQDRFREKSDVKVMSISLLEGDTTLCDVEANFNVNPEMWKVLRLTEQSAAEFAISSLFIDSPDGISFVKSTIVLVDKKRRIRGYRDASQYVEVKDLADDIKILKAEEFIPRKTKK